MRVRATDDVALKRYLFVYEFISIWFGYSLFVIGSIFASIEGLVTLNGRHSVLGIGCAGLALIAWYFTSKFKQLRSLRIYLERREAGRIDDPSGRMLLIPYIVPPAIVGLLVYRLL
jgi:hypothetical protein